MKALIRVSKNEEVIIKKVLDIGADGIVVPMIKNKQEAIEAINYAYYPPIGKRGVGLYRAQKYGMGFEEYKKWIDNELVIIAQIEHIEAVSNIEDIISVDGIDGIIIGPYDLSGSMGYPGEYHRDDVKEAIAKVLKSCKEKNIPSGFHVIESNPTKLQERIDEGCTFLAYSLDFFFLGDCARDGFKLINDYIEMNYNNWNKQKKDVQKSKKLVWFEERDIVFMKMGQNIGVEENGKGDEFLRPVLVYKKFNKEQFFGFPLTSKEKNGKFYYELHHQNRISYVILTQMRTYSAKRIAYSMGSIGKNKFAEIHKKFLKLLTPS